jgi:hypothetical protein
MTEPLPDTAAPATLDCPACQQVITYYDVAGSYYYGCPHCGTYFKYENDDPPIILGTYGLSSTGPLLPIGAEGYLFGEWVRMVGYTVKREKGTTYAWAEYYVLLKNGQYRTLSEYQNHWMWSEPTAHDIQAYNSHKQVFDFEKEFAHAGAYTYDITNDRIYRLFNKYQIELVRAVGEFDYDLLDEARLTVFEYIQPPTMLVAEVEGATPTWYKADYVPTDVLEQAFGLAAGTLPKPYNVGAIQPNPVEERMGPVMRVYALGAIIALVLHMVLAVIDKHPAQVLRQTLELPTDSTVVGNERSTLRTNSFQLNGPTYVGIDFETELTNQWAEFESDLVNEKTGQSYSFTKAVEFYEGVEDGERWTEGNKTDDASLSNIPSGRYHLTVKPFTDAKGLRVNVTVHAGPAPFSNVLIWLLLSGLYPLYVFFKGQWLEHDRWAQSDYNPNDPA